MSFKRPIKNNIVASLLIILYLVASVNEGFAAKRISTRQKVKNLEKRVKILTDSINTLNSSIISLNENLYQTKKENNNFKELITNVDKKLAVFEAKNEGYIKSANYYAPFYAGLILLIVGLAAYNARGLAKQTAKEEIEETHDKFCKEMAIMKDEAEATLAQIKSYHETCKAFENLPINLTMNNLLTAFTTNANSTASNNESDE